jgi:hypothetical protein
MAPSGTVNLIDLIKQNSSKNKPLNDCFNTGAFGKLVNTLPVRFGEVVITHTSN